MSRKSERLVNLTIALLATRRYLTKSEIFASIEGYDGELDAKERMFERDKEDLRRLGIDIEVGSFDPLFEDEPGYRIRSENYRLEMDSLTPRQLALISLATRAWKGIALGSTAFSGLVKLKSLGIESDIGSLPAISPRLPQADNNLEKIVLAIAERKVLSFSYLAEDLSVQERNLEPYGAGTKNGNWYVAGRDFQKDALRVFRLDRIHGDVKTQGRAGAFAIPETFSMSTMLQSRARNEEATLRIRRGKANSLIAKSAMQEENDEWITIKYPFGDLEELVRDVLWHHDDVILLSPQEAVDLLISRVEEVAIRHGA